MPNKLSREQKANICLMLIYAIFANNNINYLIHQFKISVLILAIFNTALVFISILRRPPTKISFSKFDIIISTLGSFFGFLLIAGEIQSEILFFQILGILGLLISLTGLFFLNKSFGFLPADRGVITNGIYRFIRHPIYTGYFISIFCFVAQNYTLWNVGVFIFFVIFETTRLLREEKLLKQNPEYLEYTKKVRWRILPYIW